jgi:NAD(P)-dependent dehydrogenase (short-subunit alcohol dehydrogenase family)
MSERMSVRGKVIAITGASSGLGRHFSKYLASQGATIAACARRMPLLEELVAEIEGAGGRAMAVPVDVTDAASVEGLFETIRRGIGTPDVLINNAGATHTKPLHDLTEAEWDIVVDTNLKGAFMLSRAFSQQWRTGGRPGCIINIASILGIRVTGLVAPYAASKAGLIHLTQALAFELARFSIRVNAIAPGYIETDMNRWYFQTEPGQALLKRIPQRRLGQAEDLEDVLQLLASDASAYMTGVTIPVDGGHLCSAL